MNISDMLDDDSLLSLFDFHGDTTPSTINENVENLIDGEHQDTLNKLKVQFCHDDLIYLREHKEVISDHTETNN